METLFPAFSAISAEIYNCEFCHTICSKKNDWTRHLATQKHLRNTMAKLETKNSASEFRCKCGKHYNSKSGLWKHTKGCTYKPAKTQFLKNIKVLNLDRSLITERYFLQIKHDTKKAENAKIEVSSTE